MNDNLSFKNIFKRETKLATYIVICLTIVVLSLSYAMFFKVDGNSKNQVVEAGDLVFTYENSSQTITQEGKESCFMPMSAEETQLYLGTCDYKLSVQNTGSLKGAYTLKLVANAENTIEANKLKVVLRKQEGDTFQIVSGYENGKTVSELSNGILIEDEEMERNSTVVFSVSLIIDESVATEGDTSKVLSYKIEGTGLVHDSQDLSSILTYCDEHPQEAACQILAKGETEELKFDGTVDNNLRYVGSDPNNYVSFNNELWRIIGVFNNIDNGTGTKETRLKIVKNDPLSDGTINAFIWDNSVIENGKRVDGDNDWRVSGLQTLLNDTYYNSTSTVYDDDSINFSTTGLSVQARSLVDNAVWNLGSTATFNDVTTKMFYERERGTTVYEGRATEWTGKIGLIYPSDYGYATSGGGNTTRESCVNYVLYNWNNYTECYSNDWLYTNKDFWLLTSFANNYSVFNIEDTGQLNGQDADAFSYSVYPSLYLSSNVKITGGDGSESSPFTLSL